MAHARRLLALATVGLLAFTTACTSAEAVPEGPKQAAESLPAAVVEPMGAAVEHAMAMSRSTGAIVGVWAPWAGSWTTALGAASTDGSEPMSTDMRFRVADSTKAMTCTVLLGLVDDGVVKLDDPVSTYVPHIVGLDGITLRQLCQNTSGLSDYVSALQWQLVNNPTRVYPPIELITDAMGQGRVAEPGSVWSSSNAGFLILGLALRRASKQSWDELYNKYVFERLSMTASSLPSGLTIPGENPQGYAFATDASGALICDALRDETQLSPSMAWTAGGVVSSLDDLHVFAQAFARGALVSEKSAKAQWQTVPLGADAASWQGYGLGGVQLGPLRGSAGAIPGFASAMLSDPESGLTVVVMLNNSSAGAGIAQSLAMQLASFASKAPAQQGEAPVIVLPWSDQQAADAVTAAAVCQPPAEPAPEE